MCYRFLCDRLMFLRKGESFLFSRREVELFDPKYEKQALNALSELILDALSISLLAE